MDDIAPKARKPRKAKTERLAETEAATAPLAEDVRWPETPGIAAAVERLDHGTEPPIKIDKVRALVETVPPAFKDYVERQLVDLTSNTLPAGTSEQEVADEIEAERVWTLAGRLRAGDTAWGVDNGFDENVREARLLMAEARRQIAEHTPAQPYRSDDVPKRCCARCRHWWVKDVPFPDQPGHEDIRECGHPNLLGYSAGDAEQPILTRPYFGCVQWEVRNG